MTLLEMSALYAESAAALRRRIGELRQAARELKDEEDRRLLRRRITELTPLLQETRELAALTAHYYDRSYHRHERYTLCRPQQRVDRGHDRLAAGPCGG